MNFGKFEMISHLNPHDDCVYIIVGILQHLLELLTRGFIERHKRLWLHLLLCEVFKVLWKEVEKLLKEKLGEEINFNSHFLSKTLQVLCHCRGSSGSQRPLRYTTDSATASRTSAQTL